jgi:hypothetical protein
MSNLVDFDLDIDEEMDEVVDDIRLKRSAQEGVEKAMLSWCSNGGLVSSFSAAYLLPAPI